MIDIGERAFLQIIVGVGHAWPAKLTERLLALIDSHLHGKMTAQSRLQMA